MNKFPLLTCSFMASPQPSAQAIETFSSTTPSCFLRLNLLVTDLGFLLYWLVSAFSLLPSDWLYKDATNPILLAWNWSFAPVDLVASITGLVALRLAQSSSKAWQSLAVVSAALTFCAGLLAISFWAIRHDFELAWWLPNLYLVIWPLGVLNELLTKNKNA